MINRLADVNFSGNRFNMTLPFHSCHYRELYRAESAWQSNGHSDFKQSDQPRVDEQFNK